MNNVITTRLQVLLAKISGQDIDLSCMTPGVAASLDEKLMLDIADRIDNISSATLPSVNKQDAGKFCVVNDSGEWAAVSVPAAKGRSF